MDCYSNYTYKHLLPHINTTQKYDVFNHIDNGVFWQIFFLIRKNLIFSTNFLVTYFGLEAKQPEQEYCTDFGDSQIWTKFG